MRLNVMLNVPVSPDKTRDRFHTLLRAPSSYFIQFYYNVPLFSSRHCRSDAFLIENFNCVRSLFYSPPLSQKKKSRFGLLSNNALTDLAPLMAGSSTAQEMSSVSWATGEFFVCSLFVLVLLIVFY